MKAHRKLAETITPDGGQLSLYEHDGTFAIRLDGQGLMDSSLTASEILLGRVGTARITSQPGARILIGGLGLGFTLKSVLENVAPTASVHVAELLPAVVDWNREYLQGLNGALLEDPRAHIHVDDVFNLLAKTQATPFDVILLDVDNGPSAMVHHSNSRLYSSRGIRQVYSALKSGGRAVIWSAGADEAFARNLRHAGFALEVMRAKSHEGARSAGVVLYIADKKQSDARLKVATASVKQE